MLEDLFIHLLLNYNRPAWADRAGGIIPIFHTFIHSAMNYVLWAMLFPSRSSQSTKETTS